MRSGQAVGTVVRCVSRTVVQSDVVDVKTSAVRYREAMNWVVQNIEIVYRAGAKNLAKLDEVVGLSDTAIATQTVPPRSAICVENSALGSSDLNVSATDLDEGVVGIGVFPESGAFEGDLGTSL